MSPEKFLPMAVGAVVLIVVAVLIYTRLKKVHKKLEEAVGSAVDKMLKQSLTDTVKKEQLRLGKMYNKSVDMNTQNQFHKAICSYMVKNNYPIVNKNTTDAILDGNMGELIGMMYNNCGIDDSIGLGLVGWLKQDKVVILDSIDKLSTNLNLDRNLNLIVAEIALDKYNPDLVGINLAQGTIILSLKKLFRMSFPQFPLETLDGLLQVVSEGDPRPLEALLSKLNIPPALFKLAIGFVVDNDLKVQDSIRELCKDILPDYYEDLFESLYTIYKGNPKAGLKDVTENLGIQYEFLTQFIIAIIKQDNNLIRLALSKSVDQIFTAVSQDGVYISRDNSTQLKNFLLSIYTLSRGSSFNMMNLVKESFTDIDPYVVNIFYSASRGSIKKFDKVLDSLGLISQKKAIIEFCHLLFEKDYSLKEISAKLGVYPENADILHALIRIMIISAKYFIRIKPKFASKEDMNRPGSFDDGTQFGNTLIELSADLKKYLFVLYNNNVIPVHEFGFRGKFVKLTSFIRELYYEFFGHDENREPIQFKDVDMQSRKETITASSNIEIQKILKGDQSVIDKIFKHTCDYLEFKTEKRNYVKSLCTVITSFIVDVPFKELDDNSEHQAAFKLTTLLLDIDEEYLEFILDVFSGNPYRIFKCNTPNPKINLKTNEIMADFSTSRLATISDIINTKKRQTKKLSAIWIHSHDLVNNGENYIKKLATERLNIDPMFFFFIVMKHNLTYIKTHEFTKLDLSTSIRKFLNSHLRRIKYNVQNHVNYRPFFFEDLRTEEEEDHGTDDEPGLDDLPPDHEIFDNPLAAVNGRSIEDVLSFIKILEVIVKIKEGEASIFEKLFKIDKPLAKTISVIYKSISDKDLESYISVLLNLSRSVEVRLGVVNDKDQPDDDLFDELLNIEFKDLEKSFTKNQTNQSIFLQFILLFTCNKLNYLLNTTSFERYRIEKKLNTLFFTLNTFLPESQKLMTSALTYEEIFPSLFESGFFKKISKYFFHKVKPVTKAIMKPESIFGVIVGLSLQNKNLIRNSLIKLIGKQVNTRYINGLFGFIVNDPIQEKDMRAVIKKINLNADLALNLVELVTDSTQRDKYNAALTI